MRSVEQPSLGQLAHHVRHRILDVSFEADLGHLGSNLSVVECLVAIYYQQQQDAIAGLESKFVLSKGHAALANYLVAEAFGAQYPDLVREYLSNSSQFGTHPHPDAGGVEFASGSLGQGIQFAVGLGVANKLRNTGSRVYCLVSDAELNEGSSWEALMTGAKNAAGLTVLVDYNNQQAMGTGSDIVDLSRLADAVRALGWHADEVPGHDLPALTRSLSRATSNGAPTMILCSTVSGKGISFMERDVAWHYRRLDQWTREQALGQLRRGAPREN